MRWLTFWENISSKKRGIDPFYYEPSYGITYQGEKEEAERNFEKDAVAG
jgi:hypothetical protein